ncbi:MAG TPA: T9SS type A sorting domain-containing protein [Saprospiraceae bacterium]|nr:T9SS type A sorting domain-containing protein [Saprospiraceae bacterium]
MKFLSTFLLFCALAFQFPAWGQSGILDSTFAGTGMIQLRHEGNSTFTTKIGLQIALSVFPNPVTSGNIQISYSLEQDTKVTLTLLPSGGIPAKRLMQTAHRQAGNQLESLELPNDLPAGQYFLLLETSLGSQLIPVIKI